MPNNKKKQVNKTPTSPRTRNQKRNQHDTGENSTSPTKSPDAGALEELPKEIEELALCKILKDLAFSINKIDKGKLLKNKLVIENFRDTQQIFAAWQTPQKPTENSDRTKKRKRSGIVSNGDEGPKNTEETIKGLENKIEEMKRLLDAKEAESKESEARFKMELEKCKHDLENEAYAHQKTKTEENVKNAKLQKTSEQLLDEKRTLYKELVTIKEEIEESRRQVQSKNEKLESLSEELIERSDYIEKKRTEIDALKQQCSRLNSELGMKSEEMNDLRNRFSSLSASKLDGDPNIADLGDPNRPLNLVNKYQHLYDELWTDVFDQLISSYTDLTDNSEKERKAVEEILSIFKDVWSFCKTVICDQEKTVISSLLCRSEEDADEDDCCIDISTIRNIRKTNAKSILPYLLKMYLRQSHHDLTGSLEDFTKECVEICWLSLVQDPPMVYEFDYTHGSSIDRDLMRDFTVSGDLVDFVVWPTLRLHKDGPVMSKSVVQPIKNS